MSVPERHTRVIDWSGPPDSDGRRCGTVTVNGAWIAVRRGANGILYLQDATGRWRRPGEIVLIAAPTR